MTTASTYPPGLAASGAAALDRSDSDVVLIVDDVPDNLGGAARRARRIGLHRAGGHHGEAALQRAAQALPDIVLLDAMMPGMDGFEVARRLKADAATAHIPIIFMTGLTETEHLVAALEAGGVDYVTKPIKPKEVLARMGVHLRGARPAGRQPAGAQCARRLRLRQHHRARGRGRWCGRRRWRASCCCVLRHQRPQAPRAVQDWLRRHVRRRAEPPRSNPRAWRWSRAHAA